MALNPINEVHALQIQAGTLGRRRGHAFEDEVTATINGLEYPWMPPKQPTGHVRTGVPGEILLNYIAAHLGYQRVELARAISTGALATSEAGREWLEINGASVSRCKSDLVITLHSPGGATVTVGVSTKQCNNTSPTNAQLYFTTARGFTTLLRNNGIGISDRALKAMREFCGDPGYRPLDMDGGAARKVDPRRWFWEEVDRDGRAEWERVFSAHQDDITRLLLTKGYIDDAFTPEFLIHKTRRSLNPESVEVAVYSIDELVSLSRRYQGFATREYCVRKGSYKDPAGVVHLAPRFGVVQMQRGGQQQHPEQLQFNLEAGYFYKLENLITNVLG